MPKKAKKKGGKEGSKSDTDVTPPVDPRVLKVTELHDLIKANKAEQRAKTAKARKLTLPLRRINSLPAIHPSVPLVRTLFPGSKSVNLGFEPPIPDIPNAEVFLDEVPDDIIEKFKAMTPPPATRPSLSFMGKDVDDTEISLLGDVAKRDGKAFLEQRVGKDNMDAILKDEEVFAKVVDERPRTSLRCKLTIFLLLLFIPLIIGAAILTFPSLPTPPPPPNTTASTTGAKLLTVPVVASVEPFTFLPPEKKFFPYCSFIDGTFFCNKTQTLESYPLGPVTDTTKFNYIRSYYPILIRRAMSKLGFNNGNSIMTSAEILQDKIKVQVRVTFLPRHIANLVWLGAEFASGTKSFKRQTYVFVQRALLPLAKLMDGLECSMAYEDLNDCGNSFQVIGVLYEKYVGPERPPGIDDEFEGIISRFYDT